MTESDPEAPQAAVSSDRNATPADAAPARALTGELFGVSLKVTGDDRPALARLRALYGRLPSIDHEPADTEAPATEDGRANRAAVSTVVVDARLAAPTAHGSGRLTLRVGAARRDIDLPGDAPRRALTAHLSMAQAAAARARGHVLHGALLAQAADRVLILGTAGAGKSTLALALRARGWSLLADDFAWLDAGGSWRVTMLPALIDEAAADRLDITLDSESGAYRSVDGRVLRPSAWPMPPGGADGAPGDPDRTSEAWGRTVAVLLTAPVGTPDGTADSRERSVAPTIQRRAVSTALAELSAFDVGLAGRRFLDGEEGVALLRSAARLHAALRLREVALVAVTRGDPALTAESLEQVFVSPPQGSVPEVGPWAESAVARLRSEGTSMRPLIGPGAHLRVRGGAAKVGDVVVAQDGRRTIVHRLIERRADTVLLRGDDTPAPDPPLPTRALRGRVVAVEGLDARRLDDSAARIVGRAAARWGRLPLGDGRGRRPRTIVRLADALSPWRRMPTAEERFVLLAARITHDEANIEAARALALRGLQGATVLAIARRAQLAPLVYHGVRTLESAGGPMLDPATSDALRVLYAASWARSRRIATLRDALLTRLAEQDIPVLGHKGIVLAQQVYGDPALRLQGDLDLSVPDAQRRRAETAVHDLLAALRAEHPNLRDPDGLRVELDGTAHHDVDPSTHGAGRWACTSFDWTGIWQRARPLELGDARAPLLVPAPSDLLLTLIANAVRRGAHTGRILADLSATSHALADDIDWSFVTTTLQRTGLDRRSWWPLSLAVDYFGAAIPAALCEPPTSLRMAPWEHAILNWRNGRPFARVPTRLLWAGSAHGLFETSVHIAAGALRRRLKAARS